MYCTGGSKKDPALRPRQSHPMVCATFRLKLSKPISQTATRWFTSLRLKKILRTPCPARSVRTFIRGLQIFTPLKTSYNFTKIFKEIFWTPKHIFTQKFRTVYLLKTCAFIKTYLSKVLNFLKYVVHMSLFWHFLLWAFTVFAHDNFSIPADDFRNKPFNQIYSRKAENKFPKNSC